MVDAIVSRLREAAGDAWVEPERLSVQSRIKARRGQVVVIVAEATFRIGDVEFTLTLPGPGSAERIRTRREV